ncbi:alpha/beta hydrolase [Photobacterium sp. 1_MG-2023]|uniref:alpha/beta hydrolase n=1 Tax=Photobacterium sp. 1_MG-2023 TaxID=3062646 RepID=UPI0026E2A831|nr:prolyl oligopeptidase family serine peptidase [Photobacterium sp. 1_MG-2023]MDO6708606.1 prolyl oligopeptidase family serine peptidase [Photobacterium sp. 1_MG-2023]
MKKLLMFCWLSGVSLGIHASEPITREDGSEITYYLKKGTDDALLILMQGSDCNSVAHNDNINRQFSQVMAQADILTVEKYGITAQLPWNPNPERQDCPAAYLRHDSPAQRAQDYLKVLQTIHAAQGYQRIVVLGGSEGALVAQMLAQETDLISHVIALNGGGRFFLDDVLFNMKSQMPPEAYPEAEAGFRQFASQVTQSDAMELTMSGHGFPWWKSMFTLDQQQLLSAIDVPVLLMQGAKDTQVDPAAFSAMTDRLKSSKPNLMTTLYPDLDHGFRDPQGQSQAGQVVRDIRHWLERK